MSRSVVDKSGRARAELPDAASFPHYFLPLLFCYCNFTAINFTSTVSIKPNIKALKYKIFSQPAKPRHQFVSKQNWWTPLWNGLLLEPEAKHYKAMGRAVWLYLYLLTFANRSTGKLFRRLPTVAKDTGIGVRTIRRWLARLRQNGYINTRQTGRSLEIEITKWKPINKH